MSLEAVRAQISQAPIPRTSTLQPPATLIMGAPGSGKTDVQLTFVEAGIELFVLVTEPTGVDSLLDSAERRKLPVDKLHWAVVPPASPGFAALNDMSKLVSAMSYKDLSELKMGIGKDKMVQFPKLLSLMDNFVDERTGNAYGSVLSWGPDRAFTLDSLSGLNTIAMQHTVGFKPSPHQGEWGIAMSLEEAVLLKLSSDCKCFFQLTAHLDREPDEIAGTSKIMVSALGRKLAPKIPRYFSEVVLATRNANGFLWSTASSEADLKNRALPVSKELKPSFVPIVDAYRRRVAKALSSPAAT
jgi:hypothetical protein